MKRSVLLEGIRNRAKLFQVETDLVLPAISPEQLQRLYVLDFVKFTIESVFEGQFKICNGALIPSITGKAFVNADSTLLFDPADPFCMGIPAC